MSSCIRLFLDGFRVASRAFHGLWEVPRCVRISPSKRVVSRRVGSLCLPLMSIALSQAEHRHSGRELHQACYTSAHSRCNSSLPPSYRVTCPCSLYKVPRALEAAEVKTVGRLVGGGEREVVREALSRPRGGVGKTKMGGSNLSVRMYHELSWLVVCGCQTR